MVGKLLSDYQNKTWPIRGPHHPHPTNPRPGGSSIKVTDTWILREEVTWENGGKVMAPDSAYLLGTPTLPLSHPAGGSGATEARSYKQIMEIAIKIDSMVFIETLELFCIKHESLMVLKIVQM